MARSRTITTTGIVLTRNSRDDEWTIARPGMPVLTVHHVDPSLDDCAAAAGLTNGYWLRQHQLGGVTTWTWVQL